MNKFLIVLLAICLVSVHAFVKRDAPEVPKPDFSLDNVQKQLQDWAKDMQGKMSKITDPEAMKKNFNDMVDNLNQMIHRLNSTSTA